MDTVSLITAIIALLLAIVAMILVFMRPKLGKQGPTGPPGGNGSIGLTGDGGGPVGFDGPTGPQGSIGPTGFQGPQGFQGIAGDINSAGPQGPQGFQGNIGPEGLKGPAGSNSGSLPLSIQQITPAPDINGNSGNPWLNNVIIGNKTGSLKNINYVSTTSGTIGIQLQMNGKTPIPPAVGDKFYITNLSSGKIYLWTQDLGRPQFYQTMVIMNFSNTASDIGSPSSFQSRNIYIDPYTTWELTYIGQYTNYYSGNSKNPTPSCYVYAMSYLGFAGTN